MSAVSNPEGESPQTPELAAPLPEFKLPKGCALKRELRSHSGWRLCEAVHDSEGEVLLTSLTIEGAKTDSTKWLSGLLQALQKAKRPEFLAPLAVRVDAKLLHVSRSVPPGRTLRDVLEERRSFSRPTVARLLVAIFTAYSVLSDIAKRSFVATSLDQFWLPQGEGADENNLVLDASQVVIESICSQTVQTDASVSHFARLALLLLGQQVGELSDTEVPPFIQVPELSAETNALLRRALVPAAEGDTDLPLPRFLAQLTAVLAGHTAVAQASRPVLKVPAALHAVAPKLAQRLRLKPKNAEQPTIALVADDHVLLGRASTHSDYVAQIRPSNPVNDKRTRSISRVQAEVFLQNGQVFLADVSTTNPTFTAGRQLGNPEMADFPMTLILAGEYALEVRTLRSAYNAPGPVVKEWPTPKRRSPRRGGCAFYTLDRGTLPFETAWVFTDVSLCADDQGRLAFDDNEPEKSAVRFHHHGDCFWVEATSAAPVGLNSLELQAGEVAPLNPGDKLRVLDQWFDVQGYAIEAVPKT